MIENKEVVEITVSSEIVKAIDKVDRLTNMLMEILGINEIAATDSDGVVYSGELNYIEGKVSALNESLQYVVECATEIKRRL